MTTATTTFTRNTMVQRIAESIFERLPSKDAVKFFAAIPDAVGGDGKDLTCVGWQFMAQALRNMPRQLPEIQEVVDQVIDGLELLAAGGQWPADAADAAIYSSISVQWVADAAGWDAAAAAGYAAAAAADDARRQWAADAAASACWANAWAFAAACWADAAVAEAAAAAEAASASAFAAACCADAAAAAAVAQQRDLLLQLLTNAPVLEGSA